MSDRNLDSHPQLLEFSLFLDATSLTPHRKDIRISKRGPGSLSESELLAKHMILCSTAVCSSHHCKGTLLQNEGTNAAHQNLCTKSRQKLQGTKASGHIVPLRLGGMPLRTADVSPCCGGWTSLDDPKTQNTNRLQLKGDLALIAWRSTQICRKIVTETLAGTADKR